MHAHLIAILSDKISPGHEIILTSMEKSPLDVKAMLGLIL